MFEHLHSRMAQLAARKGRREAAISAIEECSPSSPAAPQPVQRAITLPGMEEVRTAAGRFFRREVVTTAAELRLSGDFPSTIAAALIHKADTFADDARPAWESVCYLDTETTGLAGGTGTVVFQLGIGWWERSDSEGVWSFRLVQLLAVDFPDEEALLGEALRLLAPFRVLCTYNGRSFDMPLLRARGVMNRLRSPLWSLPNCDLLHPARRLWKGVLPSCSLRSVESDVLGVQRIADVPGAEIPELFFAAAKSGDPTPLMPVLDHNAQDLFSLAALSIHLSKIAENPFGENFLTRSGEWAGLARWLSAQHRWLDAANAQQRAIDLEADATQQRALRLVQGRYWKRAGAWREAAALWRRLQGTPLRQSGEAWLELAKYQEHVLQDHGAALSTVRGCLRQLELEHELAQLRREDEATLRWFAAFARALDARHKRLMRKCSTKRG